MLKPHDISEFLGRVYLESSTEEVAINGIYPFTSQVLTEFDLLTEASKSVWSSHTPDDRQKPVVADPGVPKLNLKVSKPVSDLVLPGDIQPIPEDKNRTSNPRKVATWAKVFTFSPYKNHSLLAKTRERGRDHDQNDCSTGIPENSDTICPSSETSYSRDTCGEEWIQCYSCILWSHTDCAGFEDQYYICDFCHYV